MGQPQLTTQQLVAARLLVQGMDTAHVAEKVGATRRSINRWKRMPHFRAEVRRQNDLLLTVQTRQAQSNVQPAPPPRTPRRKARDLDDDLDDPQQDAEDERWVNGMMAEFAALRPR